MRALAAKGGLLGITTPISRPPGEVPFTHIQPHELERTLACIRYAVDAMGPTHVGLGTHFNSACLPWVTEGLLNAGFTDDQVADIMGGNYLRLLRQVLPE
jgi:microsomal dipeptidase-like Zn-dependent dipeptidase